MLATLLLAAPAAVRTEALIDALWPDDPPPTAKAQLHNLVSRLRGRLGAEVITSGIAGYELRLDGHRLDLHEFRSLAATGALDDALALWRGPALANVPDELAAGLRQALHDERLAVIETRMAAELEAGRTEDVLRELRELIREHPYREGLREQHMRALLKAGRRAEALEAYRRTHRVFADELGIKPGEGLRRLEQQALHGIAVRPRNCPRTSSRWPGGTNWYRRSARRTVSSCCSDLAAWASQCWHSRSRIGWRPSSPTGSCTRTCEPLPQRTRCSAGSCGRSGPSRPRTVRSGSPCTAAISLTAGCSWCWTTPETRSRSARC